MLNLQRTWDVKPILIGEKNIPEAELTTKDWNDIYKYLKQIPRIAKVQRKTSETEIQIELNLDGSGKSSIDTGIRFFRSHA